jgi:RNA polymerase sigma-70 factor (ECF subfamily)
VRPSAGEVPALEWFRSLGRRFLRAQTFPLEAAGLPLLEAAGLPLFADEPGALTGPGIGPRMSVPFASFRPSAGPFAPAAPLARTGHPGKDAGQPPESPARGGKSGDETAYEPQPSPGDGVPEDMATMVLDSPALVTGSPTGSPPRLNPAPESGLNVRGDVDPAGDAAVMLRVAAGDEAGFNYLVEKYHRPMIHFLYRMVHNQSVAEELTQEVFLRVYRARDSYRAEARFTTWLYRIATNLAVNHARDTRHERTAQTVYLDAPDEETGATPDLADDEPTVEQHLLREERMKAIRDHVMALPERQRMAVLMHKYQGMDYRQIGEVLKLSESATKSLLFRAYQTLREKLKNFV